MEHKCITCGKEVQIGIWKRVPGRILTGNYFVCDECVEKVGIIDKGIKGGLQVLSYSMERFVEKYNSVTGSSISANLIKETKDKQKDEERARLLESRLKKMIVAKPGLNLQIGEVCYYQGKANAVYMKNVVTGNTRSSFHIGGKALKSTYLGSGISNSNNIRENVAERFPGTFFITNKRFMLNALKHGFDIPLQAVSTMDIMKDALSIMANGKTYVVETPDILKIKTLLEINNEYMALKRKDNFSADSTEVVTEGEKQIPELLREYKKLLDEGILTLDEFNKKKRQLLK